MKLLARLVAWLREAPETVEDADAAQEAARAVEEMKTIRAFERTMPGQKV
jgi:hypothetical protein